MVVDGAGPRIGSVSGAQFFREFIRFGDRAVDEMESPRALRGEICRRRMGGAAAADERDASAADVELKRLFQRLGKPVAVGGVAVKTSALDGDCVDASRDLRFLRDVVEEGEDCIFMGDGDVESGKSAASLFCEFLQIIMPDMFREVFRIETEGFDSGVLHCGGERMGDRIADNCKFYHFFPLCGFVSPRLSCILLYINIGAFYEKSTGK